MQTEHILAFALFVGCLSAASLIAFSHYMPLVLPLRKTGAYMTLRRRNEWRKGLNQVSSNQTLHTPHASFFSKGGTGPTHPHVGTAWLRWLHRLRQWNGSTNTSYLMLFARESSATFSDSTGSFGSSTHHIETVSVLILSEGACGYPACDLLLEALCVYRDEHSSSLIIE